MLLSDSLEIKISTGKGKGVFATKDIPAGTLVADYLGTIVPSDTCDESQRDYVMWYSDKADICPDLTSEGAHLLNTSCETNCGRLIIQRHQVIFTLRTVFAGEELTYDYFLGSQSSDDMAGGDNCHCGSPVCRGTLFSNPSQHDEWVALKACLTEATSEEPPVAYGERLPPLQTYPDTFEDMPVYSLFGAKHVDPVCMDASVFLSVPAMRTAIRRTGKRLTFEGIPMMVEGVLFSGQVISRAL